jgi:hypothetical protein
MKTGRSMEMPPDYARMRNDLIEAFPKENIQNMDILSVEKFLTSRGMEIKPYLVLEEDDISKVREIIGSADFFHGMLEGGEFAGSYIPELDMAFVFRRGKVKEAISSSGDIFSEGLLVHELGHASSEYREYVTTEGKSAAVPRIGFCLTEHQFGDSVPMRGLLLEEGWADMLYGDYIADTPKEKKHLLTEALGDDMERLITFPLPGIGKVEMPLKYVYLDEDNSPSVRITSLAAYALELLCQKNPNIKPLLSEGRHSVDALRKLAQEINKIEPGLYEYLQVGNYTLDSFGTKLAHILSLV